MLFEDLVVGVEVQGRGEGADVRDDGGRGQRRGGGEEGELGHLAVRRGDGALADATVITACSLLHLLFPTGGVVLLYSKAHHLETHGGSRLHSLQASHSLLGNTSL